MVPKWKKIEEIELYHIANYIAEPAHLTVSFLIITKNKTVVPKIQNTNQAAVLCSCL